MSPEYVVLCDRVDTSRGIHLTGVSTTGSYSQGRRNAHACCGSHDISRQFVIERGTEFLGFGECDWSDTHGVSLACICEYDCQDISVVKSQLSLRRDFPRFLALPVNINLLELGGKREHRYIETSAHEGVL